MKLNYVPFKTKRRRFNGNHKTIFILTSTDLPLKKEFFPILRNVYKRERNQETNLGEIKKKSNQSEAPPHPECHGQKEVCCKMHEFV